jgi:hypothetical protein
MTGQFHACGRNCWRGRGPDCFKRLSRVRIPVGFRTAFLVPAQPK